jgi:hypothetical protein
MKLLMILTLLAATGDPPMTKHFTVTCVGLEDYEIRVKFDVDWGWGTMRSRLDHYSVGFAYGVMWQSDVRPQTPGIGPIRSEKVGDVTLKYAGIKTKPARFVVSTRNSYFESIDLVIPRAADRARLLSIARTLATHPCRYNALK